MKSQYDERGYQVFRAAFSPDDVGALADMAYDLVTPYRGKILRQNGKLEFNEFLPQAAYQHWGTDHGTYTVLIANPLLNGHMSLPEGLEPISAAVRALITSPALYSRLTQLDGADHYTIHQTILFIAASTTNIHLDSWTLDTAPHGSAHTVWIPLQDMDYESGVPCVMPWPRNKVVTESELGLTAADLPFGERYERYHQAFSKRLLASGPDVATSFMRKGDFVVWSSLTPHCTLPSRPRYIKRLSLQVLLRPTHLPWGNFVVQPKELEHHDAERVNERFSFLRA
jgi:Phytanoyl-CoA dioxygenase (PhyH)